MFKFKNIDYDTDGEECPPELPREITVKVKDEEFDPSEDGADLISDETGFCVKSFQWEQIAKESANLGGVKGVEKDEAQSFLAPAKIEGEEGVRL